MYVDKYCYKLDVDLNNKYGKMIKPTESIMKIDKK